jgi:hypothetical protein
MEEHLPEEENIFHVHTSRQQSAEFSQSSTLDLSLAKSISLYPRRIAARKYRPEHCFQRPWSLAFGSVIERFFLTCRGLLTMG